MEYDFILGFLIIILFTWVVFKLLQNEYKKGYQEFLQKEAAINTAKAVKSVKPKREPIPESVKMYVWKRDEGKCVNCKSNEKLEYDHIIPISKGGSNTARNIQLLCESCNRSKSAKIGLEDDFEND